MKLSGIGRILFWNGGSLWVGRSEEPTDYHSHHAVQITVSFSNEGVQFRQPGGEWHNYYGAIISANQSHAFDGRGKFVGMIFVEPESREGRVLQQRCRGHGIDSISMGVIDTEIAALFNLYNQKAINSDLVAAARSVVHALTATSVDVDKVLDKRIKRAMDLVRTRIGETILLSEIAADACLSPDRFRHLFVEETGIRFRPYILWLRIELALAAFVAGKSLTEASHIGGFADSAHFSRTFKDVFGFAPSGLQLLTGHIELPG